MSATAHEQSQPLARMRAQPAAAGTSVSRITEILRRESPDLLDYFSWRTGVDEDAADMLSEVMLVAWRKVNSIPHDDVEARMWLFGVARRVLLTQRRGSQRRDGLTKRLQAESTLGAQSINVMGDEDDRQSDLREHVRLLVSNLAGVDQEIVTLYHWTGFSLKEIDKLLSMKEATVRSHYSRARNHLRDALIRDQSLP